MNVRQPILQVCFYKTDNGKEKKKCIGEDNKTAQLRWPIGMPLIRKIDKDIWEVWTKNKDGISRVFFTVIDNAMILIHGFNKKSQSTPKHELKIAMDRLKNLKGL